MGGRWRALDLTDASDEFRARFWSKVDVRGPDECWPWTAYVRSNGYGQFTLRKGYFLPASRVSLALTVPLSERDVACHRCDNPPCVNPAHLFKGTQRENGLDAYAKGRNHSLRGEQHRDARLTAADVRHIRSQEITPGRKAELARQYGISWNSINKVLSGKSWRHVT